MVQEEAQRLKSNRPLFYVKAQLLSLWKSVDFLSKLRDTAVFIRQTKVSRVEVGGSQETRGKIKKNK